MPIAPPKTLRPLAAAPVALVLAAACWAPALRAEDVPQSPPTTPAAEPPARWEPWWHKLGDEQLALLIDEALAADVELTCATIRLHRQQEKAAAHAKSLGAALKRIFAAPAEQPAPDPTVETAGRIASQRSGLAARIAATYIEARRVQEIEALRATMLDQYKDNAEIAAFRRDAGLVPAIDAALARSQDEGVRAELGYSERSLSQLIAELARLSGIEPDALAERLGQTKLAAFAAPPSFAEDAQRAAQLDKARTDAARSARDARTAYREGAATFATLYVAEAALLTVERAQITARAERDEAIVRQWAAQQDEAASGDVARMARELTVPDVGQEPAPCD